MTRRRGLRVEGIDEMIESLDRIETLLQENLLANQAENEGMSEVADTLDDVRSNLQELNVDVDTAVTGIADLRSQLDTALAGAGVDQAARDEINATIDGISAKIVAALNPAVPVDPGTVTEAPPEDLQINPLRQVPFDVTIADRCRAAGLRVVEVGGWRTRGSSSFNGRGCVNHHTAGSPNGTTPSLGGVINGFSGSAPGPLANALQSRETAGDDIFYIVAAGKANHAGRGGWRGLAGNSSVYGLEIEHTGRSLLSEQRQRLAARFHAAMANGRFSASMVCQHFEWAPGRKIDAATGVDGNRFRNYVVEYMGGGPAPTPPPSPAPIPKEGEVMLYICKEDGKADSYRVLNANNELRTITKDQFLVMVEQGHQLAGGSVNKGYHPLVVLGSTVGALGSKAIGS